MRRLILPLLVLAAGLVLCYGAYSSYQDQHSGTSGKAKVTSCTGHTGRYGGGVHCTGTWVAGGSLLAGGHVVLGNITNAGHGDIGKEIDVRIHGGDHATKPSIRVSVILALIGIPIAFGGVYLVIKTARHGYAT